MRHHHERHLEDDCSKDAAGGGRTEVRQTWVGEQASQAKPEPAVTPATIMTTPIRLVNPTIAAARSLRRLTRRRGHVPLR